MSVFVSILLQSNTENVFLIKQESNCRVFNDTVQCRVIFLEEVKVFITMLTFFSVFRCGHLKETNTGYTRHKNICFIFSKVG